MTIQHETFSNDLTLAFDDVGSGPAVLVLHGGGGAADGRALRRGDVRRRARDRAGASWLRRHDVRVPVLVVWGESDRVVTPAYGRAVAASFPDARLAILERCGHMPQIEQPQRLLELVATMP